MPRRPLITERDVLRARRERASTLDVTGAVVTPAARDLAAARGITLVDGQVSTAAPSTAARKTSSAPVKAPVEEATPGAAARVVLGADHGGVGLKDALLAFVRERGHAVSDLGTFGSEAVDYPDFAIAVARAVAEGRAELGIMIDGAGIGSCMTANKVPGVRAAMCYDVTTASNAREHNNANVLTLGGTLLGARLAQDIVRTFLDTPFAGGRHAKRVDKIDALLPATPHAPTTRR
ncbi:MAG: ribose 5-phosphate isomerase B [Gemmatimonadaceae bacterium]